MKSIEGNFDNPEVNELLKKHFVELRSVSPAGSTHVLDTNGLKDPSRHHLNQNGLRGVIRKSFMNHCIIGGRAMYGNLFVEDTCPGTEVSHFAVKTAVHNCQCHNQTSQSQLDKF